MKGARDEEFYSPHCPSVDKAGHLFVCDSSNHRVRVFKLNGECIRKFGAPGTEKGTLNAPISTALLSDGRVTVTAFDNHRVQVFE